MKPQSKRRDQPPVTADEIRRMADLFPDYCRLTLWLSLLVGGLRLGEVCALQLRDIDLENLQLHVRHSVNRGPDDRGKYRLCEPKTKSSKRVVPIPKPLAPLIEDHISQFCKDRKPDTMLFHSPMLDEWLLPPTTIERTFRMAREKIGRPTSLSTHCVPRAPPCSFSRAGPCARRWTTSDTSASPSQWIATSAS